MEQYRFIRAAILVLALLFLLVLAYRFKPRLDTPAPALPSSDIGSTFEGLQSEGFRHVQQSGGSVDFIVTAKAVRESTSGERLLDNPRVVIPHPEGPGDRGSGRLGAWHPETQTLRIWEEAQMEVSGWTCRSSGFRFTPEGEAVSEGPAAFEKGSMRGRGDLLSFHRARRDLRLQGDVRFEDPGKRFRCDRLLLDLVRHSGKLIGSVRLDTLNGSVNAPSGRILLTNRNRLETLFLDAPVEGCWQGGTFRSDMLEARFDALGAATSYLLAGSVRIDTAGKRPRTFTSERLLLIPNESAPWKWEAPDPFRLEGGPDLLVGTAGQGTLGSAEQATGDIRGPVRGRDASGDFSGDSAALRAGAWTLAGNARVSREGENLNAQSITRYADGEAFAEGDVSGRRRAEAQREEVTFRSVRARMAPGGWPCRLEGNVRIERGSLHLKAPEVDLQAPNRLSATGEAMATFGRPDGNVDRLRGDTIDYDGDRGWVRAHGNAHGESREIVVDADTLEATMEEGESPREYVATGRARLSGPEYDAEGDRLIYDTETRRGEARRSKSAAVVIQKKPFRRLAAPTVRFSPDGMEALGTGSVGNRPKLEGSAERGGDDNG